jgi:hypothetical protein
MKQLKGKKEKEMVSKYENLEFWYCLFYANSSKVYFKLNKNQSRLQIKYRETNTINIIDLPKMSGWRSKHVEELNFM